MGTARRVLVLAYDAHPHLGSESASGWGVTEALARRWPTTAVVATPCAEAMTQVAEERDDLDLTVIGVPPTRLEVLGRRIAGLHRQLEFLSYLAWMVGARRVARAHLEVHPHDVAVHASYGVHWLPSPVVDFAIPSVWGPHGGGVRTPVSLWRHLGWKGLLGELERRVLLALFRALPATRRTARRATVVMVENEETLARVRPMRPSVDRILNRAVFAPVPDVEQTDERRRYLLFPSSLHGRKGPRLALEALARTSPAVRLVVVASGYEEGWLAQRARTLGVANRLELLGRVPREEYFRRVTEAAGVLFAGLREEGGAALVEAMKLGAPVIVLDHGGAGWIARQGLDPERVHLVPPRGRATVDELADAMETAVRRLSTDRSPMLVEEPFTQALWDAVDLAATRETRAI